MPWCYGFGLCLIREPNLSENAPSRELVAVRGCLDGPFVTVDKITVPCLARPPNHYLVLSFPSSTPQPAVMDDEGDIIYSTPLPGASSTPVSVPIAAPVPQPQQPLPPQPPAEKPADYVYYERRPDDLSSEARARATAAKVKLQSHYRFALETAIDLNIRCVCGLACTWGDIDLTVSTWMSLARSLFVAMMMTVPRCLEARSLRGPLWVYQRIASCVRSGSIRARSRSF